MLHTGSFTSLAVKTAVLSLVILWFAFSLSKFIFAKNVKILFNTY